MKAIRAWACRTNLRWVYPFDTPPMKWTDEATNHTVPVFIVRIDDVRKLTRRICRNPNSQINRAFAELGLIGKKRRKEAMTTPRKRKPTVGEKLADKWLNKESTGEATLARHIDRAVSAHTRKVCNPLVDVLKCTSWCNGCSRCKELARSALAKYKEISK